ncbi:MAG TPA: hypothetical protein VNO21_16950, partial [Polyangiaceae bacterium]|nr:hypothetical protein [Polyangiaceae bacterium]
MVACLLSWTALGCGSSSSRASAPASAPPMDQETLNRPPPSKAVEVKNLCATGVPVYIGDVPNGTTGDHVVLRGGGTSHFPREADG